MAISHLSTGRIEMNKKAFFGIAGVLAASLVLGTMFQNCANSSFDNPSADEVAVVLANDKNPPAVTVDSNATVTRDTGTGVIGGTCEPTSGPVAVSMGTLGQALAECGPNGRYEVCYVIPRLGNGTLEIRQYNTTQTESSQTVRTEVYVTTTVSTSIRFEIISIQVLNPSTGRVTIMCTPGSNIESTIYGAQQLPPNTSCPANGQLTFDVALVSGLAGTGQRVVYVKQVTQSGQVTTVFVDADNVTKTHSCSITLTASNGQYCADRMGNVAGS